MPRKDFPAADTFADDVTQADATPPGFATTEPEPPAGPPVEPPAPAEPGDPEPPTPDNSPKVYAITAGTAAPGMVEWTLATNPPARFVGREPDGPAGPLAAHERELTAKIAAQLRRDGYKVEEVASPPAAEPDTTTEPTKAEE